MNCYGIMTALPQLRTVTIKDGTLVLVRPHNPSQFPALVYAIRNSGAGLKPSDDGKQILVALPPPVSDSLRTTEPRLHLPATSRRCGKCERAQTPLRSKLRSSSQPRASRRVIGAGDRADPCRPARPRSGRRVPFSRLATTDRSCMGHAGSPAPSLLVLHPGAPQRHRSCMLGLVWQCGDPADELAGFNYLGQRHHDAEPHYPSRDSSGSRGRLRIAPCMGACRPRPAPR